MDLQLWNEKGDHMGVNEDLETNVTAMQELEGFLKLDPEAEKTYKKILVRFPMTITRYYLSLVHWEDPEDPIRRMCIPSMEENDMTGRFDTSGEGDNTVVTGLQHKYDETVLILSTHRCAMYCRHCFRKRLVGISEDETAGNFYDMADYINKHTEISNVLISGGDALLNSNQTIEMYLKVLSDMEHLDFLRIGTRTPVVYPNRVYEDQELLDILKAYNKKKRIYVVTQFNHPKEITGEARKAVDALLNAGVGIRNQTVLLKGVNDSGETMGNLLKGLNRIGVAPYYIFQCRPVSGVGTHFQVPLEIGYEIVEAAKQMQNGFGKSVRYVMSHYTGKVEILGKDQDGDMIFKYHQAKDKKNCGKIFKQTLKPMQTWLGGI